jgi:hypothetical protein
MRLTGTVSVTFPSVSLPLIVSNQTDPTCPRTATVPGNTVSGPLQFSGVGGRVFSKVLDDDLPADSYDHDFLRVGALCASDGSACSNIGVEQQHYARQAALQQAEGDGDVPAPREALDQPEKERVPAEQREAGQEDGQRLVLHREPGRETGSPKCKSRS